ncbi:hypothetical protein L195_g063618, partial [Trifolium pratense]
SSSEQVANYSLSEAQFAAANYIRGLQVHGEQIASCSEQVRVLVA